MAKKKENNERVEELEEVQEKKPYPKCVFFVLGNVFFWRYSYDGIRTILVLYLKFYLEFSEDTSTSIYQAFTVLAYPFPLLVAFLADSWLGKYKTILYISIVYAIGMVLNTLGAIWTFGELTLHTTLSMLGLLVIALGTGGIKPCVSAFGGDQFTPDQKEYRRSFFSMFYFAINAGSLVSTIVSPIIRDDVHCFERDDCYALAFGIPTALIVVAIIGFFAGRRYFIMKLPEGNVFAEVFRGIGSAIKHRWNTPRKERNKEHWLDYALVDNSAKVVRDTKYILNVLVLYIPLPFFWAVFYQQDSRWTLQATTMNRYVGAIHVEPDQMQVFNPLLIVTLIPLLEATLYPCLRHYKINFSPLRKMTLGMILAGVSFFLAAGVQLQMDKTSTVIPNDFDEASFRIINGANCRVQAFTDIYPDWAEGGSGVNLDPGDATDTLERFVNKDQIGRTFTVSYHCTDEPGLQTTAVTLVGESTWNLVVSHKETTGRLQDQLFEGISEKSEGGGAIVRLFNTLPYAVRAVIAGEDHVIQPNEISEEWDIERNVYAIALYPMINIATANSTAISNGNTIEVDTGGDYTVLVWTNSTNHVETIEYNDVYPNVVNVFWMIPQYFMFTLGEVFLSVTGLEFSYSQAPTSMKSVVASFWILTMSVGKIIALIIAEVKFVPNQANEYFLFAGLIAAVAVVFIILAIRYEYVDESEFNETEDVPLSGQSNYQKFEAGCSSKESSISSVESKKHETNGAINETFDSHYSTAL